MPHLQKVSVQPEQLGSALLQALAWSMRHLMLGIWPHAGTMQRLGNQVIVTEGRWQDLGVHAGLLQILGLFLRGVWASLLGSEEMLLARTHLGWIVISGMQD